LCQRLRVGFGVEGEFPENECRLLHLGFYTFSVQVWQATTKERHSLWKSIFREKQCYYAILCALRILPNINELLSFELNLNLILPTRLFIE
jgi:hypothetical protein